jgi:membrane associated rhomboid family serine protease
MAIPLYDDDPLEGNTTPYVTYGLIATNIIVAVAVFSIPTATYEALLKSIGLIPAIETRSMPRPSTLPRDLSLFTSMFLHADWWHLLGNMLFLWIFGDNIEDAIGRLRFFAFYILSGLGAAAAFIISAPHATIPLLGASGAIAGVMAAYLLIRPCAKIEVLVSLIPVAFPAYLAIGLWMGIQVVHLEIHANDGVAYWAHIGGAIAGALLILVMRPAHVKLFECMAPSDIPSTDPAKPLSEAERAAIPPWPKQNKPVRPWRDYDH